MLILIRILKNQVIQMLNVFIVCLLFEEWREIMDIAIDPKLNSFNIIVVHSKYFKVRAFKLKSFDEYTDFNKLFWFVTNSKPSGCFILTFAEKRSYYLPNIVECVSR